MFVSLLLYQDSPSECNVTKSYCSLIDPRFQGSAKGSVYMWWTYRHHDVRRNSSIQLK